MQNHPHAAGDMTPSVFRTSSLYTVDSHDTCMSVADTVMTKINYNGSIVSSPLSPIKLLEFLFMELRSKLKDYVSEGKRERAGLCDNCSFCVSATGDEDIAKAFTEINQTIKKAKMERRLYREVRSLWYF